MAFWYSLWSLAIFFTFWYVWTKKNLATLAERASVLCSMKNPSQFVAQTPPILWNTVLGTL
jgi:hypothetical protein